MAIDSVIEISTNLNISVFASVVIGLLTILYFLLSHLIISQHIEEKEKSIIIRAIEHLEKILYKKVNKMESSQNKKLDEILTALKALKR